MRNRFDRQLEELNEMLIHMGELCETAIEEATGALEGHDIARAKAVITADSEIDQMEKEIENLCLKLLLQQQPVARDLRRISASLKMITDMERIGDQTADIADIVIATKSTEEKNLKDINRMAEATVKMVRDSVSAYVQKDLELARKVMDADDEVDDIFDLVKGDLIKFISDHKGSAGDEAIDLIMIAKYLERIGDHAGDISEMTLLMKSDANLLLPAAAAIKASCIRIQYHAPDGRFPHHMPLLFWLFPYPGLPGQKLPFQWHALSCFPSGLIHCSTVLAVCQNDYAFNRTSL